MLCVGKPLKIKKIYKKLSELKNIIGFGSCRSNLHISLESSKMYFLTKIAKVAMTIAFATLAILVKSFFLLCNAKTLINTPIILPRYVVAWYSG